MKLNSVIEKLVLHWGEMGARWGISRMVAQIHALLYFSPKPMAADEIVETLGVARSHVSNSLKELQTWGVIKVVHVMGDRREHFQSIKDVWQLFEILLDERKRREIDPALEVLGRCEELTRGIGTADGRAFHDQMKQLKEFVAFGSAVADRVGSLPHGKAVQWAAKLMGVVA